MSVSNFVMKLPQKDLAVSHWTLVEFVSLLARKVRTHEFGMAKAHEVRIQFESLVETSFLVLRPNADDYYLARNWLGQFNTSLKSADALHLAIAMNHGATVVYSLNKLMIKAGRSLGLPVTDLTVRI